MKYLSRFCVACACLVSLDPVFGDFTVQDVEANLAERALRVSTRIELNLSEQAERAVENGVPLVVLTELELVKGGVFWDQTLAKYRNGQQLRYHSLADRYIVENLNDEHIDTYASLDEALRSMGVLRSLEIPVPEGLEVDSPAYRLEVRSRLDINRLPAPLRPLAFFSPSWRLSSDWTTWPITVP